jgi:hypothetical protein
MLGKKPREDIDEDEEDEDEDKEEEVIGSKEVVVG